MWVMASKKLSGKKLLSGNTDGEEKKNTAEGAGEVTCTLAALFPHSVKFLKCTR